MPPANNIKLLTYYTSCLLNGDLFNILNFHLKVMSRSRGKKGKQRKTRQRQPQRFLLKEQIANGFAVSEFGTNNKNLRTCPEISDSASKSAGTKSRGTSSNQEYEPPLVANGDVDPRLRMEQYAWPGLGKSIYQMIKGECPGFGGGTMVTVSGTGRPEWSAA
jgi:hypothetical protein